MESRIITGLDIGTSKICAIITREDAEGKLNIMGVGTAPSRGIRKGVVVNIDQTVQAIRQAMDEAQQMAGVEVERVFVGIAGDHINSLTSKGIVGVSREDKEITQEDVDRAIRAAKALALPIDREIIHVIPQEFIVDDQDGIPDPVGMTGVRLEVEVHIVTAAVTSAQNVVRSVERAGYLVQDIVLEPLASSLAVLDDDERELGVVLVDLGGGTTDIAMFFEGNIRATAVVALGGQHVTNDIAIGLRTPPEQAEHIKTQYGAIFHDQIRADEEILVPSVGGRPSRKLSRSVLVDIIQPRMEEILSLAYQKMKETDLIELMAAGAVITGGGALLPGTVELAEQIWGLPVKLGLPKPMGGLTNAVQNPSYSTGVGLCLYGAEYYDGDPLSEKKGDNLWENVYETLKRIFRKFF